MSYEKILSLKCPYCGCTPSGLEEAFWVERRGIEMAEVDCGACGKSLIFTRETRYTIERNYMKFFGDIS